MMGEGFHFRRKPLEENEVRDYADQPQKRLGHERADHSDRQRKQNEQEHSRIRAEIAQKRF
jgi:hypothetical protein